MTASLRFLCPAFVLLGGCVAIPAAFAQPPMEFSAAEMVARADTDGDGKLSRDEFIKARTSGLEQNFARMDTDGDGKLDEKEVEAGTGQARAMAAGAGFRRPPGQRPQRPEGERPRAAGEGRPQRPGEDAMAAQGFDRMDTDGDGKLSREEFLAGMARLRASMQPGGAGPRGPDGVGRPGRDRRGPEGGFRQPPRQDDKDGGAERPPAR